jgi:hypothetical protein
VPPAVRAFLEADGYEEAVRLAVSLGGDCDTLACTAGAIARAYYGIPDPIRGEALRSHSRADGPSAAGRADHRRPGRHDAEGPLALPADRVTFAGASATDYPGEGYDPVAHFDCLHDMGDPVGAAQMVMGEEYDEEAGFVYGYALEFICRHLGEFLPNGEWSAMRAEWAETADRALEASGVGEKALRLRRLMSRGSPVPLPEIEDFPAIGYLRLEEVQAALAAFGEDQLAAVKDKELRSYLAKLRG